MAFAFAYADEVSVARPVRAGLAVATSAGTTLAAIGLALVLAFAPAAQSRDGTASGGGVDPSGWQTIITGQIEAMRRADAAGALALAGEAFRAANPTPSTFLMGVENVGYGPIIESERHSFGAFDVIGEGHVRQSVMVVGTDLHLYRATYLLLAEEEGWRVQGVSIEDTNALAV